MRAVICARYSTDLQSTASAEDQVRLCRGWIDRHGGNYLHACADAMSGASTLRPGYQKLLEDARARWFDAAQLPAPHHIALAHNLNTQLAREKPSCA
jgi:DNA invertase Pin-like site-specific DNA recombinase